MKYSRLIEYVYCLYWWHFLKRNKTYKFIFTWIHSKYVKWFLTSNETFSSKIGEVWKATYICEDIFISAHILILHISSIKYEYCTFHVVLLLHMCWKVNIFVTVKMVFTTYYFWWKTYKKLIYSWKPIIFHNTNISHMHSLWKFGQPGGSLLKETFDVKLRLEVIYCLDFTEI